MTGTVIDLHIPGLAPGLRMRVHERGDRVISATLQRDHCWEAYETALTLQHLKPGDVYVDVGANIGYYTLVAARRVGATGKVFAYEPDADNYALLQTNVVLNQLPQVNTFACGLCNQNREGTLFLSAENFGDHRIYAAGENRPQRAISLVHGSTHLATHSRRIDFLKIDTQGAEFFVLDGLRELVLENRKHLTLMLEFCPYGIRHSGADGQQLVKLLEETGLRIDIVDHQRDCLIPAELHHLSDWVSAMEKEPANEGFVNLLMTPP